jgi:hypothetical protein
VQGFGRTVFHLCPERGRIIVSSWAPLGANLHLHREHSGVSGYGHQSMRIRFFNLCISFAIVDVLSHPNCLVKAARSLDVKSDGKLVCGGPSVCLPLSKIHFADLKISPRLAPVTPASPSLVEHSLQMLSLSSLSKRVTTQA